MSPSAVAVASTKRPLEDEASSADPTDQPDAKRPALDKVAKEESGATNVNTDEQNEQTASKTLESASVDQPAPVENGGNNLSDPAASEATNGTDPQPMETHAIPSTGGQYDRASSQGPQQHQMHQDESGWLHMRAIISSAEAATVIGKGGENVSIIRRHSGAKCTVSDYSRGAVERVLTVSGQVDAVAKVSTSSSSLTQANLAGIWTHHSNTQQRANRGSINCSVQDVPPSTTNSTHLDRFNHWKIRCSNPRDSRSIRGAPQCLRKYATSINGAFFGCARGSRRRSHCQLLRGTNSGGTIDRTLWWACCVRVCNPKRWTCGCCSRRYASCALRTSACQW